MGGLLSRPTYELSRPLIGILNSWLERGAVQGGLVLQVKCGAHEAATVRDRKEDISDLARYFLNKAPVSDLPLKTIAADGLIVLNKHQWPGNVRELENLMYRITALYTEPVISAAYTKAGNKSDLHTS